MIHTLLFSLLVIGAALLPPRSCAAALTLADTSAGYSLTLPEGWEPLSSDIARQKGEAFKQLLPVPEDGSVRMQAQGAVLRQQGLQPGQQPDLDLAPEVLILSIPNTAFGIDAAALSQLAEPGNALLKELAADLHAALEHFGMTVRNSAMLADGLRLSYGPDTAAGVRHDSPDAVFRVMEFRFSTSHLIAAIFNRAKATDASLPATLTIAPEKRLGQEKESLNKFKENMSSLFAIAAMLVMILVMRRYRRQQLSK